MFTDLHKWRLAGSVFLRVKVRKGFVEEGKEFAKEQGNAHGIGFFGVKGKMDIVSLRVTQSRCWNRELQAGAGEETAFVAFVQPVGYIRCGKT